MSNQNDEEVSIYSWAQNCPSKWFLFSVSLCWILSDPYPSCNIVKYSNGPKGISMSREHALKTKNVSMFFQIRQLLSIRQLIQLFAYFMENSHIGWHAMKQDHSTIRYFNTINIWHDMSDKWRSYYHVISACRTFGMGHDVWCFVLPQYSSMSDIWHEIWRVVLHAIALI